MAGRRPKPTVLRLVQGNPGKRPLNRSEPKPKRKSPIRPAHLSEKAKTAWPKVSRILSGLSVLTVADGLSLEGLCEAYADYLDSREELRKAGSAYYQIATEGGGVMWRAHPALAVRNDADRRLRAWLVEFGLTPAARSKVKMDGDAQESDPAARFFA